MTRPTALYPVSEYGEFFSLVEVAKIVDAEFGLHPVFLFAMDYGALETHSQVLERLNFSWTTATSRQLYFDARGIQPGVSDYIPSRPPQLQPPPAAANPTPATGQAAPSARARSYAGKLAIEALYFISRLRSRVDDRRGGGRHSTRRPSFRLRDYYKVKLALVSGIVERFRPKIIISGQDFPLSITTLASHTGARRGVRTVIIPFSMMPTTKEIAESFFGSRTNELRSRRLLAYGEKRAPHWLHTYRGRIYSRLSLPEAIASDALGLTPPQVWTPNSGLGIVLAPSEQGQVYGLAAGIPAEQLRLTGALWSDRLLAQAGTRDKRREALFRDILVFETYARNLARSRTVPRNPDPIRVESTDMQRTLLVFSWPPNQRPRRPFGFANADELNTALAEMLIALAMSASVKIAVSLHPTLVGTPLGAELKRAGLYVIDKPLIDVIDCADIFCATVSSTLLWSVQAGVPAVNLDIYGYGYTEFREAGMCESETLPQLRAELLRLVEDKPYRGEVAARQAATRDYWTLPDGKARERITEAIRGMLT